MFVENDLGAVSAVGRRAAAIYGASWREVLQLMVGCFDASGHEDDQPFLVVAGFVSSAGDWDDFSVKWLERLGRDGLTYFHANKFAASSDIFSGWKDDERRRRVLAQDLMDLVVSHAYRYFVIGVRPPEFKSAFTEEERETFNINSYAFCGRACVAELGRWLRRDSMQWDLARVPDLIFEDGDIGKGKLRNMLVRHQYPEPQFLPGKKPLQTALGIVQPHVPLQAADWLAYEAFRLLKLNTIDRDEWRWPMRQFFDRMQGLLGFYPKDGLEQVKDDLSALDEGEQPGVVIASLGADGRFI